DMVNMGINIVNKQGKTSVTVNEMEVVACSARDSVSACLSKEENDNYTVTHYEEIIESGTEYVLDAITSWVVPGGQ
ncbi:hypothetical protein SK128_008163, partial [Halocaridina rubra]